MDALGDIDGRYGTGGHTMLSKGPTGDTMLCNGPGVYLHGFVKAIL